MQAKDAVARATAPAVGGDGGGTGGGGISNHFGGAGRRRRAGSAKAQARRGLGVLRPVKIEKR